MTAHAGENASLYSTFGKQYSISQKTENQSTLRPSNTTFGLIPKGYTLILQRHLLKCVHSSIMWKQLRFIRYGVHACICLISVPLIQKKKKNLRTHSRGSSNNVSELWVNQDSIVRHYLKNLLPFNHGFPTLVPLPKSSHSPGTAISKYVSYIVSTNTSQYVLSIAHEAGRALSLARAELPFFPEPNYNRVCLNYGHLFPSLTSKFQGLCFCFCWVFYLHACLPHVYLVPKGHQ